MFTGWCYLIHGRSISINWQPPNSPNNGLVVYVTPMRRSIHQQISACRNQICHDMSGMPSFRTGDQRTRANSIGRSFTQPMVAPQRLLPPVQGTYTAGFFSPKSKTNDITWDGFSGEKPSMDRPSELDEGSNGWICKSPGRPLQHVLPGLRAQLVPGRRRHSPGLRASSSHQ